MPGAYSTSWMSSEVLSPPWTHNQLQSPSQSLGHANSKLTPCTKFRVMDYTDLTEPALLVVAVSYTSTINASNGDCLPICRWLESLCGLPWMSGTCSWSLPASTDHPHLTVSSSESSATCWSITSWPRKQCHSISCYLVILTPRILNGSAATQPIQSVINCNACLIPPTFTNTSPFQHTYIVGP